MPATHNSMSVPLPGWYSSEQDHPIAQQLKDGIRGLLIDTHYAERLASGKLRTDIPDDRATATEDQCSQVLAAALRTREQLGFSGRGKRGIYLCHTLCELGGTPLGEALKEIHSFLIANPEQVVVVINQDYVTPRDFVRAVETAGLADMAYRGGTTGHWPTLREAVLCGSLRSVSSVYGGSGVPRSTAGSSAGPCSASPTAPRR